MISYRADFFKKIKPRWDFDDLLKEIKNMFPTAKFSQDGKEVEIEYKRGTYYICLDSYNRLWISSSRVDPFMVDGFEEIYRFIQEES